MSIRPSGIVSDLTATGAGAFMRIELNPVANIVINELGISMNAAPNSTDVPQEFLVRRNSAVSTGAAGTVVNLEDGGVVLGTTALVDCTADGAVQDELHRFFVPVVTGMIWVAAPGREFNCAAADFVGFRNELILATGVAATSYLVFEE